MKLSGQSRRKVARAPETNEESGRDGSPLPRAQDVAARTTLPFTQGQ